MAMELRVYDCPSCGAPLPPAGLGSEVTCTSCGARTTLADGSDAILRERRSRAEAEALYGKLGKPPRWSQRVATYLVSWKLWLLGFPFLLGILWTISLKLRGSFEAAYERLFHARFVHVVSPFVGWLFERGYMVAIVLALLVWSLLGERIDARRELQAMLAAKLPETEGGTTRCRKCDAPLEVAAGALGTRCPYCGADNLVVLPADWVAQARTTDSELRLTTALARDKARQGRRRMYAAAAWRLPLVGVLTWFLLGPALASRGEASWSDMRSGDIILYKVATRGRDDLRAITTCAKRTRLKDPPFDTHSNGACGTLGCEAYAVLPLARSETLHLVRTSPGVVAVRIALEGTYYFGGYVSRNDNDGDELVHVNLPETELVQPIAISGWYHVYLFSREPTAVGVQPCVD